MRGRSRPRQSAAYIGVDGGEGIAIGRADPVECVVVHLDATMEINRRATEVKRQCSLG